MGSDASGSTVDARERSDPPRPPTGHRLRDTPWKIAALASLPGLAGVWLGYGTDIDVANVLRAGQSALDGDYHYSRPPGALPHEVLTRVVDLAAGSVGTALVAVVLGFLSLWAVGWLVREDGRPPAPTIVLVAANPWWWVATTSVGDFVWALSALLGGVVLCRRRARFAAGILFGVAIGIRASTVLLVLAWLAAELLGARRVAWKQVAVTGATAAGTAALLFVPSWLAADQSTAFLSNEFEVSGVGALAARWFVKNLAFFGVATLVVLAFLVPALVRRCVAAWPSSVLIRFSIIGLAVVQLLFLRFPWKPLHLLPAWVLLAVIVGTLALRWQLVLIGTGILHALVAVTVAAPDVPNRATTGDVHVSVVPGVVVNEVQCRLDDRQRGAWPAVESEEARLRSEEAFDCQGDLWRSPPREP